MPSRSSKLSFATVPGLLVEHAENKTLAGSLTWLFVSGKGATRQLLTYRQMRTPDIAAGVFVAAAAAGLATAARGKRLAGAAIPAAAVLAISAQHVRSRFETPRAQWTRLVPAVAVNSTLITAYLAGRIAGLTVLPRVLRRRVHPPSGREPESA